MMKRDGPRGVSSQRIIKERNTMKTGWLPLLLGCAGFVCAQQTSDWKGDYLGQPPPGNSAVIFAPDIVSRADSHGRLVVSPDGKELFWNRVNISTLETRLYHVIRNDSVWSSPEICPFALNGLTANPVFSMDGEKLVFEYRDDKNSSWEFRTVEKVNGVWSEPGNDGSPMKWSSSFTDNGKIVYTDTMANTPWGNGIYSADYSMTGLSNVQPLPAVINSAGIVNYTPFISPDDSYLLFSSNRPVTGSNDTNMHLHISFHTDGAWTAPQKIHDAIGFSGNARFPSISPDGKYLFFCGDDGNIYWVSMNAVQRLIPARVETRNTLPADFYLDQNHPNPFNPATVIHYRLSNDDRVRLKIFNALGREIRTLVNSFQNAGEHSIAWDGTDDNMNPAGSGVYFYSLSTDDVSFQKKMVLAR
jgi:hypothetical protein